jgi:hypothetical protein
VPVEFLDLSNITCGHLTLRGSGSWTVNPPPACGDHEKSVHVDLGPSGPFDQPAPILGRTDFVTLR